MHELHFRTRHRLRPFAEKPLDQCANTGLILQTRIATRTSADRPDQTVSINNDRLAGMFKISCGLRSRYLSTSTLWE